MKTHLHNNDNVTMKNEQNNINQNDIPNFYSHSYVEYIFIFLW